MIPYNYWFSFSYIWKRLKKSKRHRFLLLRLHSLCLLLLCEVSCCVGITGAVVRRVGSVEVGCVEGQHTIGTRASNPHMEGIFPFFSSSLAAWHWSMFLQTPAEPSRVLQESPESKPNALVRSSNWQQCNTDAACFVPGCSNLLPTLLLFSSVYLGKCLWPDCMPPKKKNYPLLCRLWSSGLWRCVVL
jgi:hypothetical protein